MSCIYYRLGDHHVFRPAAINFYVKKKTGLLRCNVN